MSQSVLREAMAQGGLGSLRPGTGGAAGQELNQRPDSEGLHDTGNNCHARSESGGRLLCRGLRVCNAG